MLKGARFRAWNTMSRISGRGISGMPVEIATQRFFSGLPISKEIGARFGNSQALPAEITLITSGIQGVNLTNRDFGTVSIGAAHIRRKIVVGVSIGDNDADSAGTVTGVSLGGNAMNEVVQASRADCAASLWELDEHTAATTATLTMTGSTAHVNAVYAVWRVLTTASAAAATDSGTGSSPSGSVNIAFTSPAKSVVMMIGSWAGGDALSSLPWTWAGDITSRTFQQSNGSGEDVEGSQATYASEEAFSTTVTFNSTDEPGYALVGASFGP